jgi:polar amino acid transport system substrate-binding protein
MKKISIPVTVGAGILVAALLQGCSDSDESIPTVAEDCQPTHSSISTIEEGKLIVSVYVSAPYSELPPRGGELGGIDGEIVKEIAARECLELDARPVDGAAFVSSITSKRGDVAIGGIVANPERAEVMDLSTPMYRDGMGVLSKASVSSVDDLSGKKIGVVQGYLWNEQLTSKFGADNVKVYQDPTSVLSDLKAGRVDVAVFTTAEVQYRAEQDRALKAGPFPKDAAIPASAENSDVVLASTKGNAQLTEALNADIADLLEDGTIADILEQNNIPVDLAGAGS